MNDGDPARIRPLTPADLDDAVALSTAAGWNQRPDDWRMLMRLASRGATAAERAGRVVGTAIGIDYGGFGWIAMMLVDPAHRHRGLGSGLLTAALATLRPTLTVRLDATPLGRPLYERHGFRDETRLLRYVAADPRPARVPPGGAAPQVRPLHADDLSGLRGHDAAVFGGDRHELLAWAAAAAPGYAWITTTAQRPPQYCLGRRGRLYDQIGPVAACDGQTACALVRAAMAAAEGRPLVVDAFDGHEEFTGWLRAGGFEPQRPLFRMYKPAPDHEPWPNRARSMESREFAIMGPEFA